MWWRACFATACVPCFERSLTNIFSSTRCSFEEGAVLILRMTCRCLQETDANSDRSVGHAIGLACNDNVQIVVLGTRLSAFLQEVCPVVSTKRHCRSRRWVYLLRYLFRMMWKFVHVQPRQTFPCEWRPDLDFHTTGGEWDSDDPRGAGQECGSSGDQGRADRPDRRVLTGVSSINSSMVRAGRTLHSQ